VNDKALPAKWPVEAIPLGEETKTLITMLNHQGQVRSRLRALARELEKRADLHDLSKFKADEFEGFVEINQIARKYPFGSPEYKASISGNQTVDLHFSRNRHHPEYHANGIRDMNFIDFVEMVVDWLGATATYGTGTFEDALKKQIERFDLQPDELHLIRLIARWFGE
jgi:hypothetical protein